MKSAILIGSVLVLGGCSVGMAARTGGVKTEVVTQCQARDCFLTQDTVEILETVSNESGGVSETYRFQLKRGSAGRAAMHGLLDVATLGIWEVAGTPIEATKKKKYIVITANYAEDGRLISKMIGNPVLLPDAPTDALEGMPPGTPVTANGEIVGVLTEDGEFVPILNQETDGADTEETDQVDTEELIEAES